MLHRPRMGWVWGRWCYMGAKLTFMLGRNKGKARGEAWNCDAVFSYPRSRQRGRGIATKRPIIYGQQ